MKKIREEVSRSDMYIKKKRISRTAKTVSQCPVIKTNRTVCAFVPQMHTNLFRDSMRAHLHISVPVQTALSTLMCVSLLRLLPFDINHNIILADVDDAFWKMPVVLRTPREKLQSEKGRKK